MQENLKTKKWTLENSFDKKSGSTGAPQWPHEFLVKVFSSKAYSNLTHELIPLNKSLKVLEIGCMGANNLRFFSQKNCEIYGVEVTEDLVSLARSRCDLYEIQNSNILCGHNQSIPFDDASMDILVSVNTLHYDHGEENIHKSLANFSRVLKGGALHLLRLLRRGTLSFKMHLRNRNFALNQIIMILEKGICSDFLRMQHSSNLL